MNKVTRIHDGHTWNEEHYVFNHQGELITKATSARRLSVQTGLNYKSIKNAAYQQSSLKGWVIMTASELEDYKSIKRLLHECRRRDIRWVLEGVDGALKYFRYYKDARQYLIDNMLDSIIVRGRDAEDYYDEDQLLAAEPNKAFSV